MKAKTELHGEVLLLEGEPQEVAHFLNLIRGVRKQRKTKRKYRKRRTKPTNDKYIEALNAYRKNSISPSEALHRGGIGACTKTIEALMKLGKAHGVTVRRKIRKRYR